MLDTPILGLPYPEPGDPSTTWLYWQQLGERVEAMLCPACIRAVGTSQAVNATPAALQIPTASADYPQAGWVYESAQRAWRPPRTGIYLLMGLAVFANAATTNRVQIRVNGAIAADGTFADSGYQRAMILHTVPATTDLVSVWVSSTTGQSVTPELMALRVAPLPTA